MAHATWDLGRESHWRTVIARWRRSGRTVREFCQAEGISEPSFYAWRRKLAPVETRDPVTAPAFLPVQIIASEERQRTTGGIEVVLANGRRLHVPPGFDPHTLIQLIALLETGEAPC